ncbi:MAG: ABC transporter [Halobacteriovoraceae bacterium]|nr:ABC transporter [Halobacteriovoraceae bacterium]
MSSFEQLKRLYSYSQDLKSEIIWATLYSILNKIFDLAPPILIGMAVDIVVKKEESYLSQYGLHEVMDQLYVLAFLTFLVWAFESLFEFLFKVKWRNIAQSMQHLLRIDGHRHLQTLDLKFFEDKSSGNLISVLNDDVNQLERFLDGGANSLIQVTTTVITVGTIFIYKSPMVAIFSFLPVPLILLGSFYYQKMIQPRYRDVRDQAGLLSSLLNNSILGMLTIKSYTAEASQQSRLEAQSLSYSAANSKAIKLSSSFSPLIRMVVLMGFLFTLVLGGYYTTTGALEVGSYSVLVFMTQRLLWPLTGLGETFDLFQRAMGSTQRIFDLMDTPVEIKGGDSKKDINIDQMDMSFNDVSFQYEKSDGLILDNISFSISSGQTVGLVGPTGSGKSSLVKLLLRFYEFQKGEILLGEQSIRDWDFGLLRKSFSYVGQDVYLFNGTVADNILFGSEEGSMDDVIAAAKKAWAHDFIEELPHGYQTLIGERGQKLSGGQKQRLSLARAILKNAPIFIFDEATSAVDNETEAAIQKSLEELTKTKTAIIIAHRLSTVVNADKILVLNRGQIVEQGTHHELLENKGVYSSLWQVQTGSH